VYAVVKTGGRQYRVAVGDVLEVGTLVGQRGDTVNLPAILVVDGDAVTTEAAALAAVSVTGEVVEHTKGPKIKILKYKNKTGYRKRQGHRQGLTRVKVTGIDANGAGAAATDSSATDTTAADTNETGE
jgi:large subunit ribosomal protein L21